MSATATPAREQAILIAHPSPQVRKRLAGILSASYRVLEAADGEAALLLVRGNRMRIAAILLAFDMPGLDGLQVIRNLAYRRVLGAMPVIMLVPREGEPPLGEAYELGASDDIRDLEPTIVLRHVNNMVELAEERRHRLDVSRQHDEGLLVNILAHVVEARNGESGEHVMHIGLFTKRLLRALRAMRADDPWGLTDEKIELIATASALHDIGKLAIDEKILNKPGRLTVEEFEAIKLHTVYGADMISRMPEVDSEPLLREAHDICRWHHERYDGSGYPDGLRGEEIPISAQVVSMADVYDALTSERVYKAAYSHETAVRMILDGECGVFNPLLIACIEVLGHMLSPAMDSPVVGRRAPGGGADA